MNEVILFTSRDQMDGVIDHLEVKTILINQSKYCLTRIEQDLYVFESKCPHFDYSLANAKIHPHGRVTCPWHNYQFDLKTGKESQNRCRSLESKKARWIANGSAIINI